MHPSLWSELVYGIILSFASTLAENFEPAGIIHNGSQLYRPDFQKRNPANHAARLQAVPFGEAALKVMSGADAGGFSAKLNPFFFVDFERCGWFVGIVPMPNWPTFFIEPHLERMLEFLSLRVDVLKADHSIIYANHVLAGQTTVDYPGYPAGYHYSASPIAYVNAFDTEQGVIVTFSIAYAQDLRPDKVPPLNLFPDVMGVLWRNSAGQDPSQHKLKHWIFDNVHDEGTLMVVNAIMELSSPGSSIYHIPADSLDGKALLGTRLGGMVAVALKANPFNFGGRLTVAHIYIFSSWSTYLSSWTFHLAFSIIPDESPVPELDAEVFNDYDAASRFTAISRRVADTNWHLATVIGHRNFAMLQGHGHNPFRPPASPFTLESLPDNGWEDKPKHKPEIMFPQSLGPMYQYLGLQLNHLRRESPITYMTHSAGTTKHHYPEYPSPWHFGDYPGYFFAAFAQIQQGVLLSIPPGSAGRRPGDAQMIGVPPLYRFSDVMALLWYMKTNSQPSDNHPLKYWIIHDIKDPATMSVLAAMAYSLDRRTAAPPEAPGIECKPGSNNFNAVLGTPIGNEVAWSLASNPSHFRARRTVSTIYCLSSRRSPTVTYDLVFVLDDV